MPRYFRCSSCAGGKGNLSQMGCGGGGGGGGGEGWGSGVRGLAQNLRLFSRLCNVATHSEFHTIRELDV